MTQVSMNGSRRADAILVVADQVANAMAQPHEKRTSYSKCTIIESSRFGYHQRFIIKKVAALCGGRRGEALRRRLPEAN